MRCQVQAFYLNNTFYIYLTFTFYVCPTFTTCRFMCEGGREVARGGDGARLLLELGGNCDGRHQ